MKSKDKKSSGFSLLGVQEDDIDSRAKSNEYITTKERDRGEASLIRCEAFPRS